MIYCRASDKDASLSPGWWENINLTSTPCIINNAATATGAAIQFAIVSNFRVFFPAATFVFLVYFIHSEL